MHRVSVQSRELRHRHALEVIGDSISAGYGNLAGYVPCDFGTTFEDGFMTYGAIAARMTDADVHIEAISGIGMAVAVDGLTALRCPTTGTT